MSRTKHQASHSSAASKAAPVTTVGARPRQVDRGAASPAAPGQALGALVAGSRESAQRAMLDLQRAAGNASVNRLTLQGHPSTISVQRAATSTLSAAEKSQLEDAGLTLSRSIGQISVATNALNDYAKTAPNLLGQLRTGFDANLNLYKQAQDKVNYVISEAKEIEQVKTEVLMTFIDAATDGLTKRISLVEHDFDGIESFTLQDLRESLTGDDLMKPLADQIGQAKGAALAPTAAPPSPPFAGADQLQFEQRFEELQGKALQFLPIATLATMASQPAGRLDEAIKNARETGEVRHDQPVSKIVQQVQQLSQVTGRLASSVPIVAKATKDIQDALTVARAVAPANEDDAEKELWIDWAGRLDRSNYSAVDMDVIENYLKRKGIFSQLGIDPGHWFTDKEQVMTVCMAQAQRLINANKGLTMTLSINYGNVPDVTLPGITANLPVKLVYDPVVGHSSWREIIPIEAVVVGSTALQKADTDVLSQTQPSKSYVAEYLLSHGYVAVIMKGLRNLLPEYQPEKVIDLTPVP